MKRFNYKSFIKTGIIEKLKSKLFIKGKKDYLFYMWDYYNGSYIFNFREVKDINKSLYDEVKSLSVRLYYQHINDYENTFDLICECFDTVKDYKTTEEK